MRRTLVMASVFAVVLSLAPVVAAETARVVICHLPPGNPDEAHTITVGAPAVEHHMSEHGDTLGPCEDEEAQSPDDGGNPGNGADTGTNPDAPQGPSTSAVAAVPAIWLWLLLVALACGAVATAYVLRRRRIGSR